MNAVTRLFAAPVLTVVVKVVDDTLLPFADRAGAALGVSDVVDLSDAA